MKSPGEIYVVIVHDQSRFGRVGEEGWKDREDSPSSIPRDFSKVLIGRLTEEGMFPRTTSEGSRTSRSGGSRGRKSQFRVCRGKGEERERTDDEDVLLSETRPLRENGSVSHWSTMVRLGEGGGLTLSGD